MTSRALLFIFFACLDFQEKYEQSLYQKTDPQYNSVDVYKFYSSTNTDVLYLLLLSICKTVVIGNNETIREANTRILPTTPTTPTLQPLPSPILGIGFQSGPPFARALFGQPAKQTRQKNQTSAVETLVMRFRITLK